MGNGFSAALLCCTRPPRAAAPHHSIVEPWPSDDEALGHSFRYLHSSPRRRFPAAASPPSSPPDHHPPPILSVRAISGAAVSANSSSRPVLRPRPRPRDQGSSSPCAASPVPSNPSGFEGSSSFAAAPLQLSSAAAASASSGPLDRGSFFLSGPIERGAVSGPLDSDGGGAPFSGPLASKNRKNRRRRRAFPGSDSAVLLAAPFFFRRSVSERRSRRPWVVPLRGRPRPRVQWAQGKAGEDLVHVVVSEEHRWLFVGIYDGFNGADAPEFLVAHLYHAVFDQLRGLFWEEQEEQAAQEAAVTGAIVLKDEGEEFGGNREAPFAEEPRIRRPLWEFLADSEDGGSRTALCSVSDRFVFPSSKPRDGIGSWQKGCRKIQFSQWRYGGEGKEKATEEGTYRGRRRRWKTGTIADQGLVLQALSRALEITECAYLEMTDREISRNPELALTGSCVLVVLMRGDDVYVMNVGDSRAIIGHCRSPVEAAGVVEATEDCGDGLVSEEVEAPSRGVEEAGDQEVTQAMELVALQLSTDHSTSIEEEVRRIKEEHPDDSKCIVNNRVKGRLKVTRAFGAGFLKQPKWNNGLLEVFRNEYVGVAPYMSCSPSLCHHKLARNDQFLVVSSDGLYQYFTNEEVVSHVKNFMERFPDGDPAQSLIEELLYRAASRAGMDFFELLDIPQGDRRKYHDDVTVIVVSLEGRTWRSSGKY